MMRSLFAVALFFIFILASCHYYNLEGKLDPENAEFLDQVRYIITKEETRIFLDLPDSEKEKFKEEFWRRRDPDPGTEENEFKIEYLNRIERATELFVSEGKPGWLTDRGRIYVLFGPPTDRITYPMGGDPYSRCREIWYYGSFPVVFLDETCTGNYKLVTYDLTPLRELNLMYMHELSLAQEAAQQTILGESKYFNFDWSVKKIRAEAQMLVAKVLIEVPYASIWFKAKDGRLETVLDVSLELRDGESKVVWKYEESFEVVTDEEELKADRNKRYKVEIPVELTGNLDRLQAGANKILATVRNRTGGDQQKKVLEFRL